MKDAAEVVGWAPVAAAMLAAAMLAHKMFGNRKRQSANGSKESCSYRVWERPEVEYHALNPRWLAEMVPAAINGLPSNTDVPLCTPIADFQARAAGGALAVLAAGGPAARAELFALEEGAVYLNHGSYGACFKLALEAQAWYRSLMEAQPVRFMETALLPALLSARDQVAEVVGAAPGDVAAVPNATTAINCCVASLALRPGDALLMTSCTYPAVRSILARAAAKSGARVVEVVLPAAALAEPQAIYRRVKAAVVECRGRLRLAVLDHIASFPPVHFDVPALSALCRKHGAKVLVDGSHAVGSMPLDVPSLGCDFYTSNLHKWLCTPKGTALLWVAPAQQGAVRPAVTSHGHGLGFQGEFLWAGTKDDSGWCAVPASLAVLRALGGSAAVWAHNAALIRSGVDELQAAFGQRQVLGLGSEYSCMAAVDLPPIAGCPPSPTDAAMLHDTLREQYRIEVPVIYWQRKMWVRLSAQLYNSQDDYRQLCKALTQLGATPGVVPEQEQGSGGAGGEAAAPAAGHEGGEVANNSAMGEAPTASRLAGGEGGEGVAAACDLDAGEALVAVGLAGGKCRDEKSNGENGGTLQHGGGAEQSQQADIAKLAKGGGSAAH